MSLYSEYNGLKKSPTTTSESRPAAPPFYTSLFQFNEYYNKNDSKKDASDSKFPRNISSFISYIENFNFQTFYKENTDLVHLFIITILSLFTRLYKIGAADRVIWDEAHFGKFGAYYINGTFYHDVHPPLAKMLVGLSEYLAGFNGHFRFDSGVAFPSHVNFYFMRVFNALFGAIMAPLSYLTMLNFGSKRSTALLASSFVLFDSATCTISRFILLDAILLGFTSLSLYSLSGMYATRKTPFTTKWWYMLILTGTSLGLVSSSKWVGLFAVALVGLYTIEELYDLLGNKSTSIIQYGYHWAARIGCLIVIPILIYMLTFKIHFALLFKSGSGDSTMPSIFQAGLEGSKLGHQPFEVAYGSLVTLKGSQEYGYLHSHVDTYPQGSQQKQVTTYGHKDTNNDWRIYKQIGDKFNYTSDPLEYIADGSIISLHHVSTKSNLVVTKDFKAPLTAKYYEVCSHNNASSLPDPNSHLWKFEIISDYFSSKSKKVSALSTKFKLKHVQTGCYLRLTGKTLPDWAFGQQEVACGDDVNNFDSEELTFWNIEANSNSRISSKNQMKFKSNFLKDFIHLNKAMFKTNNALVPDHDKIDNLTSTPLDWPIVRLGLRICSYGDYDYKFFLIGNPVIWIASLIFIVLYPFQILYHLIKWKRGLYEPVFMPHVNYIYPATILWAGWFLHYFPFFIMGRVMYLHHYFPAIYFGMLFLAYQLEQCTRLFKNVKYLRNIDMIIGVLAFLNFIYFAPFTFGFDYPAIQLKYRRWLSTWDMY
ncbi:hypothetical protein BB561_000294 [Smittium simulii]|uniref:Dolichyl-phosphate-mannose--protein mannosyltransferase n=1 Tax=Smittium simulii TaxID=133385 RepID=A0A2T9YZZ8_9FUNG|nr:hypothetical protein BB561_000294 [Smittium simulii]